MIFDKWEKSEATWDGKIKYEVLTSVKEMKRKANVNTVGGIVYNFVKLNNSNFFITSQKELMQKCRCGGK